MLFERMPHRILKDLDELRKYAHTFEEAITERYRRIAQELPGATKERRDEFHKEWSSLDRFPDILRSSLLVTCYSLAEHTLNDICGRLCKKNNYSIKLSDLNGSGISRAKKYLKKVAGIEFPDKSPAWRDIVDYNRIRNIVVHNDGRLNNSDNANKVRDYIKSRPSVFQDHFYGCQPSLDTDDLNYILFRRKFCDEVIDTFKTFFEELFEAI